jgi:hypothetical protein
MIKAIETFYKGYRFRSRLEARWAVLFDSAGIEWVYEQEGYTLSDGQNYLPDFWLPRWGVFAEVKPGASIPMNSFYLAGKMDSWRQKIASDYYCINPYIPGRNDQGHNPHDEEVIIELSLSAIDSADYVFAYISSLDCFGTIAEIGYAVAKGKCVHVAIKCDCIDFMDSGGHGIFSQFGKMFKQVDLLGHDCWDQGCGAQSDHIPDAMLQAKIELGECWFAASMAKTRKVVYNDEEMDKYFRSLFPSEIAEDEVKSSILAKDTGKRVYILRDIPERHEKIKCFSIDGVSNSRFAFFSQADCIAARSARFEFNR